MTKYLLCALLAISSVSFAQAPSVDPALQNIILRNQIDAEFFAMTREVAKLGHPDVNRIMLKHLDKIEAFAKQTR